MSALRVAVVGVGHLGRHHARIYHELPDVDLVAVVDPHAGRGTDAAGKYGAKYYPDISELDVEIDAANVAVPTTAHFDVAAPLLEKGLHVLLEKPMTTTVEQARELVDIAGRSGAILQVGHVERFNPAMATVEEIIENPVYIECHRVSPYPFRSTDVGVVLDLMIHDLDIVLHLARGEVTRVVALGVAVLSETEDIANARIEFDGGCVANLTASRVSAKQERTIRVFQRDAYVSLDYAKRRAAIYRPSADFAAKRLKLRDFPPDQTGKAQAAIFGELLDVKHIQMGDEEPLKAELASFVDCIRNARRPVVSGEDGCRAVAVATEITSQIRSRAAEG